MTNHNPPILLIDAFPDWDDEGGIFSALVNYYVVWYRDVQNNYLDLDYFGNHSGNKKCSPLVYNMLDDNNELSSTKIDILARILMDKFSHDWNNRWETFYGRQTSLNDYSISETYSGSGTHTRDIDRTVTRDEEHHDNRTLNITDADSTYGFNSSDATPVDNTTRSGTDNTTFTSDDTNTDTTDDSGSTTQQYTRTFSGLKGIHTPQEIIKQEREITMYNFFDTVYKDIDSVLALPIYNRKHEVNPYSYFRHGYNMI